MKTTHTQNQKRNRKGFTLLELLVVVAILAAVAGTTAIALKDTDARASAAAHVTMMDELNKGIRTYRVLQRNTLPSNFDSLLEYDGTTIGDADFVSVAGFDPVDGLDIATLDADTAGIIADGGIGQLRYVNQSLTGVDGEITDVEDCANLAALVASRKNAVVPGNVFMSPAANGCGESLSVAENLPVAIWTGGTERLTGQEDPAGPASAYNAEDNYAYMAVGVGPSSSLFDANELGGMTSVPVYRHVGPTEYNRFIAIFNIGTYDDTGAITAGDQCELVAIVDGALDTKEEELGEWDGTRNTI